MALQSIANGMGLQLDFCSIFGGASGGVSSTMDAAGESVAFVGKIYIEGAASSKTISSAGGKITFRTGTVTFANGATNLRVGIQDLTAGGLNDDAFDVYADFAGGGGGIASNTWYEKAMTNGTKTINHLDTVAITIEMTARGGTDSVFITSYLPNVFTNANTSQFPYRVTDTGAGPTRQTTGAYGAMIIFDDGTLGWIEGIWFAPGMQAITSQTYNSGSTPDEYAAVFQVPFKCSVRGAWMYVGSIASTDNFEIILYSDAEGTPAAQKTVTVDPNYTGSTYATTSMYLVSFTEYTLSPGLWYAIAMRPTTANSLTLGYFDIGSGFGSKYKKMLPLGTNCKYSSRTNQSGAFSEVQTYFQPIAGLLINKLDDGVSTGGETGYAYP